MRTLVGLLVLLAVPSFAVAADHAIAGKVLIPDKALVGEVVLELSTSTGQRVRAFSDKSGSFVFHNVPAGTHLLHVLTLGFLYPELRVEVTNANGLSKVSLSTDPTQLIPTAPLLVRPMAPVTYYEVRRPVDVWAFIKSPYGLMISFMVFGLFVFPYLKVDPEEYREFKEGVSSRGQGGSSGGQQQQQQRVRDR